MSESLNPKPPYRKPSRPKPLSSVRPGTRQSSDPALALRMIICYDDEMKRKRDDAPGATHAQPQCRLLNDLGLLPLMAIWERVRKMPMADSCALLATCKQALSTFGGLTDRMARMQLTVSGKQPEQGRGGLLPSQKALRPCFKQALETLSWFPAAVIEKLELHVAALQHYNHEDTTSPALMNFTISAGAQLKHVTSLIICAATRKLERCWRFQTDPLFNVSVPSVSDTVCEGMMPPLLGLLPGEATPPSSAFHLSFFQTFHLNTADMASITATFPVLQKLVLGNLAYTTEPLFKPLSRLVSLRELSATTSVAFNNEALGSLSHLQQLSTLELGFEGRWAPPLTAPPLASLLPHILHIGGLSSLSLILPDDSWVDISQCQCLSGLQHLTHLSFCQPDDGAIGVEVEDIAAIASLTQLVSLALPTVTLTDGAAELVAAMPLLTHLSVSSCQPLRHLDELGAPCSWKELTLCCTEQAMLELLLLPVEGRLILATGRLEYVLEVPDENDVAGLEACARLLAPKLRSGPKICFRLDVDVNVIEPEVQLGLLSALAPLDGIIHTLELDPCFELGRPHIETLTASLPQLQSLVLRSSDVSISVWPRLSMLPALETLIIFNQPPVTPPPPSPAWGRRSSPPPLPLPDMRRGFQPEYLAYVASSLSHPLAIVVPPGGCSLDTLGCDANRCIAHATSAGVFVLHNFLAHQQQKCTCRMHHRGQGCAVSFAGGATPRRRVPDPQGAGGWAVRLRAIHLCGRPGAGFGDAGMIAVS